MLGAAAAVGMTCNAAITKTLVPATRVVWLSDSTGKYVANPGVLTEPFSGQVSVAGTKYTTLRSDSTHTAGVLLDFGRELHGGVKISAAMRANMKPVRLRVRFGESVTEAMYDINQEGNPLGATNEHGMRDFTVQAPWLGSVECGNSGFRFVRIDLVDKDTDFTMQNVSATSQIRDDKDDPRLNEIWDVGAYTVKLNMQEYLWDGIKRDRLVWVGDMHPEVLTISNVWGAHEVVPKSLDFAVADTPLPGWMNGMCSYSLWWVLIHRDYYKYRGDMDYLREQQAYLSELLRILMSKVDAEGHEHLDGGGRFLDWPTSEDQKAIDAGLHALMLMTFEAGAEMLDALGDKELAAQCTETAARMKKIVPDYTTSKQSAALIALSGIIDPQKANDEVLKVGGAHGFSTFYGYYMLQAQGMAGDYAGAIGNMKDYWGGMLDLGATTFWEDFDIDWMKNAARIDELTPAGKVDVHRTYGGYCYRGYRHSFAHGWASGPTAWLSEYVLGVPIVEPGCKVVKVEPHLGDLQWVEGTVPTPYGVIKVRHDKQADGSVKSKIEAPKGVKVVK